MSSSILLVCATIYFAILFFIASSVNKDRFRISRIISPANVYILSLAVYCTGWTFFGSVGNASKTGIGFLPVYLGPTIFFPLIIIVWLKILRICKEYRITNIADFISSRYGHSNYLGVLVTIFYIIGIIPYISLQLKAIGLCLITFTNYNAPSKINVNDSVFYFSLILIVFTILYGARNIDASEKHKGLIAAISFESIVKLFGFILVGLYVSFYIFSSPFDIFSQYQTAQLTNVLPNIFQNQFNGVSWLFVMIISALSMILLPRQFQVAIVENTNESHLNKALWMFPLYLFLINIFVIPIAIGGLLKFGNHIDPDTFVLAFPISTGNLWLTLIVFLGGLSAATGMVIVETISLSTMLSNNLVIPTFISKKLISEDRGINPQSLVVLSRRFGITIIIIGAYFFEKYVAEKVSLISIGLISFAAVSQLAPALIGGLYWRKATKKAASASILVGFFVWLFTLIFPTLDGFSPEITSIIKNGLFGIEWLKPTSLFYFSDLDKLSHGIFWSLLLNIITFIGVSIYTERDTEEIIQSEAFVKIHSNNKSQIATLIKNEIIVKDLMYIFKVFFGEERGENLIKNYFTKNNIPYIEKALTPPLLVNYSEKLLAGAIGPIATKMVIANIANQQPISMNEVLDILKENQQTIQLNKELKKKSAELGKATEELKLANEQLTLLDEQKDEFLYTVTHELRTPLTSIRALSEVLFDNPDLGETEREKYLGVIIKETERMTHLITQVLNLEKYDSGKQQLNLKTCDLVAMITEIEQSFSTILKNKNIAFEKIIPNNMFLARIDKELIEQVLYNLFSNAIKFSKSKITISFLENYNEVIISVIDDGVGIQDNQKGLIFDKFYQIKNKKLQKPDGSGLGLAISKKIIELHNRKIWVENNTPNGAIFSFSLELI